MIERQLSLTAVVRTTETSIARQSQVGQLQPPSLTRYEPKIGRKTAQYIGQINANNSLTGIAMIQFHDVYS